MSLCQASGNVGFPVVIQGTIQRATIPDTSIRTAAFKTSLSVRSVPRTYDSTTGYIDELAGQDTFIFNSTPYLLQAVQIYDARNNTVLLPAATGAPTFEGVPAFGLALSFTKQQPNYAGEAALIVLIPIYSQATVTTAAEYHVDIDKYFKEIADRSISSETRSLGIFLNYEAFRCSYSTCVELRSGNVLNMRVVLFPGYVIQSATAALYRSIPPLRVPGTLRDFQATAFRRSVNAQNQVTVSQWSEEGYCYAGLISVGDTEFYRRFTFYNSTIQPVAGPIRPGEEHLRTTQQYKCMPLDKLKDVSGSLVLLDPATGTRTTLADELELDEVVKQAEVADVLPADGGGVKAFLFRFAGTIATIVTVVFVGFLYYTLGQRFHTTENAVAAATAAVAAANAVSNAAVNNPAVSGNGQPHPANANAASAVTPPGLHLAEQQNQHPPAGQSAIPP